MSDFIDANKLAAIRAIVESARACADLASGAFEGKYGIQAETRKQCCDWFLILLNAAAESSVAVRTAKGDAIAFLRDDAAAMSYQSLGQYRTAVLRILGGVENGGQTCDMPAGPCACGAWHDAPTTRPAQMDSVCGKPNADREPKTTPFAKSIATPIQVKR